MQTTDTYEARLRDHEKHLGRASDVAVTPRGSIMNLGDAPVPAIDLPDTATEEGAHQDARPAADTMLARLGWRRTGPWGRVPGTDEWTAPVARDA